MTKQKKSVEVGMLSVESYSPCLSCVSFFHVMCMLSFIETYPSIQFELVLRNISGKQS